MTYAEAALLQPGDHVILESGKNMLEYGYCVMPDMTLHAGEEVIVRDCRDKDEISNWTGEVLATHRVFYFQDLWGNNMSYFYSEGTIARRVDPAPPATASELTDFLFSGVGL